MKTRKALFSILVVCLLGTLVWAADTPPAPSDYQIHWSRIADYPVRLSELSAIAMGDRIYVMGGKVTNDNRDIADSHDVNDNYAYDPTTNTWTRRAGMPTPRYDVALAALQGRIYAVSSRNESYDPVSDTWQQHAPLPHGGAHHAVVSFGEQIYAFSSDDKDPNLYSQNMGFDPKTNLWQGFAPIPTPRLFANSVAFHDGIYLLGGADYDDRGRLRGHRDIEVYHPATDSWESKRPMPEGVSGTAGVFDNKIFLVGDGHRRISVYDPQTEQWSHTTDRPNNYGSSAVAFHKNRIYLIGGHDEGFKQYSDAYVGVIKKEGSKEVVDTKIRDIRGMGDIRGDIRVHHTYFLARI
jgi:N-acetylneuraminic acid mutarotase